MLTPFTRIDITDAVVSCGVCGSRPSAWEDEYGFSLACANGHEIIIVAAERSLIEAIKKWNGQHSPQLTSGASACDSLTDTSNH
ncbi:MAG: hypothetical protein IPJ01_12680 [Micavibrio sp.]|nr:hypothetical protein [Micavibrio sp.]